MTNDTDTSDPNIRPLSSGEGKGRRYDLLYGRLKYLNSLPGFSEQFLQLLQPLPFWQGLDEAEKVILCDVMPCYQAPVNETLINQGDTGSFMIVLLKGSCEIYQVHQQLGTASRRRLGVSMAGAILGEMSLVEGVQRFADCTTLEETIFGVLDQEMMSQIILQHPHLGCKILTQVAQLLSRRLRTITVTLAQVTGVL